METFFVVPRKLRPIATPSVVPKTKGRTILAWPQCTGGVWRSKVNWEWVLFDFHRLSNRYDLLRQFSMSKPLKFF